MAKSKPAAKTTVPVANERPELPTAGLSFFERSVWLPGLILAALVVGVYAASISNGFVFFDDDKAILYNRALQNPGLGKFFSGQNLGMYAPISWIAYWIGSLISGEEAWGYHLLGMALHALNSLLVFALLRDLLGRFWPAFFAALLFAVHPMQVEAVSWAAALSTVLFATFYLGSLLAWVKSMRSPTLLVWPAISLILFVLACLSKSAAVTLPLVMVAISFLFFKNQLGKFWLRTIPFFLVSLVFGIYTFITREQEGHNIAASSAVFSLVDRFFMVCQTLLFYPVKLLAPFGYSISYPFVKSAGVWPWTYYAAPLALAVLAFFFFKNRWWQNRELSLALALYFLPLLVMLPLRTVGSFELRSDRYIYISCIGLFLLGGFLLEKINSVLPRVAAVMALVAVFGFLAHEQTKVWKDGISLFQNCVEKTPQSSVCQCNLAYNELLQLDFDNSADHYTQALKYDPTVIEAYNGRGQAYFQLRKIPEALDDFTKAIQAGISTPKLFLNRGKCLVMLNRAPEALQDLNKSLELEPNAPEAYYFRAIVLEKAGDPKAEADYSQAIQLNPNYVEALVNRGLIRYKSNRYDEAVADYTAAVNIASANVLPMILTNRAAAQIALGKPDAAVADASKALEINANYKRALETRAAAYLKLNQPARAQADMDQAGRLK